MLKRLELIGFKSFAEKTGFDFRPGVTAIVGPNGSGKSNIIDAVRWLLGEQSAKSLRGGEMADVIFNGAAGRKSLGMAEVSMVFDNRPWPLILADHQGTPAPATGGNGPLNNPAPEVRITRRVYRDGEGEYLINGQLCRLKDIKDLFLGSGAGTSAYCIIEQGRVDALLQASTKDRRAIFEEAAGISRFKAKKIETLRKLERVDQNLQQLRLVVDEVDKQLRSVKLQAAKAERYQEYTGRLRELRVGMGLAEYQQVGTRLASETQRLTALRTELADAGVQTQAWEAESATLDDTLTALDTAVHAHETALAVARQDVATGRASAAHEAETAEQLAASLARTRQRQMELDRQAVQLQHTRTQAAAEVRAGAEQEAAQRTQTAGAAQALAASNDALIAERAGLETDRDDHREAARAQASAHSFAGSVANQLELVRHERTRLSTKATQYTEQLASLDIELEVLQRGEQDILTRKAAAWDEVLELNRQRDHWRRQAEGAKDLLAQLRAQRTGLANRVEVLEGLERSLEGLGTGVREVVALLESEKAVRTLVVGLVADVLTVPRDVAPLIDIALGEAAQRFVVRDELKLDGWLRQRTAPLAGRVGFVPLREVGRSGDELGPAGAFAAFLAEHGAERAAASVRCADAALMGVPEQLLGRTLIVPDLATARVMRSAEARFEAGPCRYVTRQGELLDDDGTLTVGTHRAETGILSRKSELRELRERLQPLDERIQATEQHYDACRSSADALDAPLQALQAKIEVLTEEAGAQRSRIGTHRSNREGLHQDLASNRTALVDYDREVQQLEDKYAAAQRQAALTDERVALLEARLEQANHTIRRLEAEREARQTASTAAQVALAQAVERLAGLHARLEQVEAEQRTLDKQRAECADQQDELGDRLRTCELAALTGSAELAAAYARKETAERALASAAGERQLARARRQHLATQIAQVRSAWQEQHQAAAATELEVNALTLRRASVAERLREDYQLDLAAEYERVGGVVPEVPTEATSEIDELRRKLSRLGSVNLESLQELIEVETRAKELATQYDDLSKSQKALQDIINTINTDSRKLFSETFETVRRHFQDLFRKLFAGGMADVILEDETDVLESGIEVVARPPGKELRSISLMSGGEKTMTAVALLLAIFRNRPSPFCLLDEVDAALDEANTARLANVLREFLDRSHFIVITHKKRTMAAADVLYGITMAESGVSKQFSVRFEDWPDDQPAAAAA